MSASVWRPRSSNMLPTTGLALVWAICRAVSPPMPAIETVHIAELRFHPSAESLGSRLSHGKSSPEYMVHNVMSIPKLPDRRPGSSRLKGTQIVRYGFYLSTRGPTATRDGVLALAREGERLGLHSAMIADHIVFPVESESIYPYTLDRRHPGGGDALETFAILGVLAGATERLRLVTSVLVLPYRNPVLTAKIVASLDVLSGGRVTLGVGVGWLTEEFEALGSPDFDKRGTVTDEWIAIFKQLWTRSPVSFTGEYYRYSNIRAEPFPLQKPHPPIWVGGHSHAALRRTARHGDGWHPVGAIAASPLPPQEMRAHLDTLKRLTEAEGRDFSALTISYKAPLYDTAIPDRDGIRRSFSGNAEDIAGDILCSYRRARTDPRLPRGIHRRERRAPAALRC
jgi:probable F420-dependent oxidoreductase